MVTADTRPIREKPVNPGGMKIDGAENDVFSGRSGHQQCQAGRGARIARPKGTSRPRRGTASPSFGAGNGACTGSGRRSTRRTGDGTGTAPVPAPSKPAVAATAAPPAPKPAPAKPLAAAAAGHPATSGHQLMVQLAALASERIRPHRVGATDEENARPDERSSAELLSDRAGRAHLLAGADRWVRRYGPGSRLLRSRPCQGRRVFGSRFLAACRCHGL